MRFRALFASAAMAASLAMTPAFAAKITVSQYGRLVATLPWAVALEKGMFKQAGLDIDGITGGFNFQAAWTTGFLAGQALSRTPVPVVG